MTVVDRLAYALAEDRAEDYLEIRSGRELRKSTYVDKWPGSAIFDLEQRMAAKLREGTYVVVVRDDKARVMRWGQIHVMRPLDALEPDDVEEPAREPRELAREPAGAGPTVERLADEVMRTALDNLRDQASAASPEVYEAIREKAFEEGRAAGRAEAADPAAGSGWDVLKQGLGVLETLGGAFIAQLGGMDFGDVDAGPPAAEPAPTTDKPTDDGGDP